jgi:AraC-like DNA-binding protein
MSGSLEVWRPSDGSALEFRVGTSFEHPYPRHWHEELFVTAITGGAGNFLFRGTEHVATPGSLVVIAPGEVHAHSDREGGRSFRSLSGPSTFAGLDDSPSSVIREPRVFRAFLRFHRAVERRDTRLHQDSLLLAFSEELPRHTGRSRSSPRVSLEYRAVRRARELLHEHFDRNVSLQELASVANLSAFHFHRVFCRETGMPPHAYQIQVRLLRAKSLLRMGRPPAEVASLTGFADQSHLHRHFKKLMSLTPAQYAGRSKNVQDS